MIRNTNHYQDLQEIIIELSILKEVLIRMDGQNATIILMANGAQHSVFIAKIYL